VPPGGTTGQALVKKSNADYDTEWKTMSGEGAEWLNDYSGSILFESHSPTITESPISV
jgi:hypothetical protein